MTDTPNTDVLAARAREVLRRHIFGNYGFERIEKRHEETIIEAMIELATPQSDGTAIPAGKDQADRDRRMYEQGRRDERAGEPEAFI